LSKTCPKPYGRAARTSPERSPCNHAALTGRIDDVWTAMM
jgi:hypothetical protein